MKSISTETLLGFLSGYFIFTAIRQVLESLPTVYLYLSGGFAGTGNFVLKWLIVGLVFELICLVVGVRLLQLGRRCIPEAMLCAVVGIALNIVGFCSFFVQQKTFAIFSINTLAFLAFLGVQVGIFILLYYIRRRDSQSR